MTGRTKIRYAVVGLGYIAQAAVLPAFAHARENSELVALVSGDATKLKKLGKKYGVEYAEAFHYIGPPKPSRVDAYVKENVVPVK